MNKLALQLPGGQVINNPNNFNPSFTSLGAVLSSLLNLVFEAAAIILFLMLLMAGFQWITSGGNKESLAKAQKRITFALVGFFIIALAFAATQFIEQVLGPAHPSPLSFRIKTAYATDLSTIYEFGNIGSVGDLISQLLPTLFSLAAVLVTAYLIWGAIKYLLAGGSKEEAAKARATITQAIIGFIILLLAFVILQFIPEFFGFNFAIFKP